MSSTFPPDFGGMPPFGSEGFRKEAESRAQEAMGYVSDPEKVLMRNALKIVVAGAKLVHVLPALRRIYDDPQHSLFTDDLRQGISPEMRAYNAEMRRKQVGALIHLISTIERTSMRQKLDGPRIEKEAQENAVSRALENLGITEDHEPGK